MRAVSRGARADLVLFRDVIARDGWTCRLCGEAIDAELARRNEQGATLDHIVPLARGGGHTLDNIQLAHYACNRRKGARTVAA